MYSQLAIVVLIDVENALRENTLRGHTYLIDNYRFMGSTGQGTEKLTTMVVGNQILNWLVTGIDLAGQQPVPALVGIGGEAVEKQILVPQFYDSPALDGNMGYWWGGTVDSNVPGTYSYTLYFDIGGTLMEFVSAVTVSTGFTMEPHEIASPYRKRSAPQKGRVLDSRLMNPENHASLFSRDEVLRMREQLNKISQ